MKSYKLYYLGVIFLLSKSIAYADLDWKETQVELKPKLDQDTGIAVFNFTNIGEDTITVKEVTSSCGCTVPKLDKKVYAPGESGKITAKYNFGSDTGFKKKYVYVNTNDAESPKTQLLIKAYIPTLVKFTPKRVSWRVGDKSEPKIIKAQIDEGQNIKILNVDTTNEAFFAKLKTIKQGKLYEITITPKDLSTISKAKVIIDTNYEGKKKTYKAYAAILSKINAK